VAESTIVKVRKDGTILIEDGAALDYTVAYEDGDFQMAWPKRESIAIRDRGSLAGERIGEQSLGTLSFTCHMREFTSASGTIVDVIDKLQTWSAATSTGGTGYESFMHRLTFTVDDIAAGVADHVLIFSKVKLSWSFAEGDPNKISVTGEVFAAPTRTGPT